MRALSISRTARRLLAEKSLAGKILAAFPQACDLILADGNVLAVVATDIGDGPLNIVVDLPGQLAGVEVDTPACLEGETLIISSLHIRLGDAQVWEPCPDWPTLRTNLDMVHTGLPALDTLAHTHCPAGSLLDHTHPSAISGMVAEAELALRAGWAGDSMSTHAGAAQLAGLGAGLTPAGDDFLTGTMLWAWLAHPGPKTWCRTVVEAAAPRTTTLSTALLRAAARGECAAAWHTLLTALTGDQARLAVAVHQVLAHGATSGADALAGFLWAGQTLGC